MARNGNDNHTVSRVSWNFDVIEGYQFAGTGSIRYQDFESDTAPGRYFPRLYYTLVKPLTSNERPVDEDGKPLSPGDELVVHAVPMISNFYEGTSIQGKMKYKWDYIEDLYDIHNIVGNPPSKLKGWLVNQPDGAGCKVWYGIKANPFLVTTWSHGVEGTYFPYYSSDYIDQAIRVIDNGYDFPPILFSVTRDPIHGIQYRVYPQEESDWWRGGCYTDVVYIDKQGIERKKRFIIYHDINHRFYAFPLSARNYELPVSENLKFGWLGFYETAEVPWPSKIDKTRIGKITRDPDNFQYRPDWTFSHNGQYACCIACSVDEPLTDGAFTRFRYGDYGGDHGKLHEYSPVLIEIKFEIEITGDKESDYSFEITRKRVIDPADDGRGIVNARYAVKDFPNIGVIADDLLILEYEMYMTNPDQRVGDAALGDILYLKEHAPYVTPNTATVAKVKNIGKVDIDGPVLFEWMAQYFGKSSVFSTDPLYKLIYNDAYYDFTPKGSDWYTYRHDKSSTPWRTQDDETVFFYSTHIQSLDLSTLTWLITATIETKAGATYQGLEGAQYPSDINVFVINDVQSIAGALQVLVIHGVEQSAEYKGYGILSTPTENMYRLQSTSIDLSAYKKFDLRATLSASPGELTEWDRFPGTSPPTIGEYLGMSDRFNLGYPSSHSMNYGSLMEHLAKLYCQNMTFNYGNSSQTVNRILGGVSFCCFWQKLRVVEGDEAAVIKRLEFDGYTPLNFLSNFTNFDIENNDIIVYPKIFDAFESGPYRTTLGMTHLKKDSMVFAGDTSYGPYHGPYVNYSIYKGTGGTYSNYPFGKIQFNRIRNTTLNPTNSLNQVIAHPNGSWAVFSTPIAVPTEKFKSYWQAHLTYDPTTFQQTTSTQSYHYITGSGNSAYEQLIIDKIHYVYQYKDKEGMLQENSTDKTHIDMHNKAFLKEEILSDYQYKLAGKGGSYYWYTVPYFEVTESGNFVLVSNTISTPYFVGGLSITNESVNPNLSESYQQMSPQGFISTFFELATVLSESFLTPIIKAQYPMTYDPYSNYLHHFNPYTIYYQDTLYQATTDTFMFQRLATPKLESTWFVASPYIDREENR